MDEEILKLKLDFLKFQQEHSSLLEQVVLEHKEKLFYFTVVLTVSLTIALIHGIFIKVHPNYRNMFNHEFPNVIVFLVVPLFLSIATTNLYFSEPSLISLLR